MVICLELGADLHMVQLIPLPLTVSCSSEIQIGFTFLVPAHLGSPGKRAIKRVCVLLHYLVNIEIQDKKFTQRMTSSFLPRMLIRFISANSRKVKTACVKCSPSAATQACSRLHYSLVAMSITCWSRPYHSSTCCRSSSTSLIWF